MSQAAQFSDRIAYDPASGVYFDPLTLLEIDGPTAAAIIDQELAAGYAIDGITNANPDQGGGGFGGVSDATNLAHLNATAAEIASHLGLTNKPKSQWTIEERKAYVESFKNSILENAAYFTPATVNIARYVNTEDYRIDPSANFEGWVADTYLGAAQAAGSPVQLAQALIDAINGLGKGLANSAPLLPLLVPLGVIAFFWLNTKSVAREARSAATF